MTSDIDAELDALEAKFKAEAPGAPTAEQGSPAWLLERVGHCTASRFKDVMDVTKKGTESAKRRNYKTDVLLERLTGNATEHFVNDAMQAGIDNEPLARMAFESATGLMVHQVGFIHHKEIKFVGGSPDGYIDEDVGVEFKCPQPTEHVRILLTEDLSDYLPQCYGLMWITNRKAWWFVSYCPQMPKGLQLYMRRILRDDDYIAELAGNVIQFLSEVEEMHKRLIALTEPEAPADADSSVTPLSEEQPDAADQTERAAT